jgi:hypothetical protein
MKKSFGSGADKQVCTAFPQFKPDSATALLRPLWKRRSRSRIAQDHTKKIELHASCVRLNRWNGTKAAKTQAADCTAGAKAVPARQT